MLFYSKKNTTRKESVNRVELTLDDLGKDKRNHGRVIWDDACNMYFFDYPTKSALSKAAFSLAKETRAAYNREKNKSIRYGREGRLLRARNEGWLHDPRPALR